MSRDNFNLDLSVSWFRATNEFSSVLSLWVVVKELESALQFKPKLVIQLETQHKDSSPFLRVLYKRNTRLTIPV